MFPVFLFNPLNFRAVTTGTSLSPAYLVWVDVNFTSAAQAGFLTSLESRWSMQLINTHWRHYFCIAVAVSGVGGSRRKREFGDACSVAGAKGSEISGWKELVKIKTSEGKAHGSASLMAF